MSIMSHNKFDICEYLYVALSVYNSRTAHMQLLGPFQ